MATSVVQGLLLGALHPLWAEFYGNWGPSLPEKQLLSPCACLALSQSSQGCPGACQAGLLEQQLQERAFPARVDTPRTRSVLGSCCVCRQSRTPSQGCLWSEYPLKSIYTVIFLSVVSCLICFAFDSFVLLYF